MRHLHLAELRSAWPAWLGVSFGFVVINFSLALCALVILTGVHATRTGVLPIEESSAFTLATAFQLVLCVIVAISVIGAATSLVVESRRGALARLALAGAAPGQMIATVMTQLTVVALASAVIGDLLALAALPGTVRLLAAERGPHVPVPEPVVAAWPLLLTALLSVGVSLIGGFRQAYLATRIPPVEALRVSARGAQDRMSVLRWLGAGGALLLIVLLGVMLPVLTAERDSETISVVFQCAVLLMLVIAVLFALLSPVIIGPFARAWTKLVPVVDPSWALARSTAVVKAGRFGKSVVPVMIATALVFGMVGIAATLNATMAVNDVGLQLEHVGPLAFASLLGLPVAVAISGGVGVLIMMSKQRDAELALTGVVGTTVGQRVAMPVFEGLIIAVTGTILGLIAAGAGIAYLAAAFPLVGWQLGLELPLIELLVTFVVCAAVTVASTTLPTLASLRRPEPAVIARLVAE